MAYNKALFDELTKDDRALLQFEIAHFEHNAFEQFVQAHIKMLQLDMQQIPTTGTAEEVGRIYKEKVDQQKFWNGMQDLITQLRNEFFSVAPPHKEG